MAATLFIVFGIWTYIELAYAIAIGVAIFFGLKTFATQRKRSMDKLVGEGFCAECGEKIVEKKCPNCDSETK